MSGEDPIYDYAKDGPLSQSRVPGKPAAPEKDILATYDEIFAWGDNETNEPLQLQEEDQPAGEDVKSNECEGSNGEMNNANVVSSESVPELALKEDDSSESGVLAPSDDALFADFMADLRKARERVAVTDAPNEEAGDVGESASKLSQIPLGEKTEAAPTGMVEDVMMTASVQPSVSNSGRIETCVEKKTVENPASTIATYPADVIPQQKMIRKKSRRRHIKDMSVLSVSQTLKSMGLPYVAKVFEDENINGDIARFLDDDLLRNKLKILTVSERQRTMDWIAQYY